MYALQTQQIQNRLDLISGGSTVGHVRVGDIRNLWMFIPFSQSEQEKIAKLLDAVCVKIETEQQQCNKFRAVEFAKHVSYKMLEIDNGAIFSAPVKKFDKCFKEQEVGNSEVRTFQTSGRVINEKLKKSK